MQGRFRSSTVVAMTALSFVLILALSPGVVINAALMPCTSDGFLNAIKTAGDHVMDCTRPTTIVLTSDFGGFTATSIDGQYNLTVDGGGHFCTTGSPQDVTLFRMSFTNLKSFVSAFGPPASTTFVEVNIYRFLGSVIYGPFSMSTWNFNRSAIYDMSTVTGPVFYFYYSGPNLNLYMTTINTPNSSGGLTSGQVTVTIDYCTIVNAVGIAADVSSLFIQRSYMTIVYLYSGSTVPSWTSGGYNVIDFPYRLTPNSNDLYGADAKLDPSPQFIDGSFTPVIVPQAGSPLINFVRDPSPPQYDQIFRPRVQGGTPDVGAFETSVPTIAPTTTAPTTSSPAKKNPCRRSAIGPNNKSGVNNKSGPNNKSNPSNCRGPNNPFHPAGPNNPYGPDNS